MDAWTNKICFIYCVNQNRVWQESLRYLKALNVPKGYTMEIIPIEKAASMTSGYNKAMEQSDAKYKVYLHQDVHILNPDFVEDMVTIFQRNPNLGLMGVIGASYIPSSALWWDCGDNYGLVRGSHSGEMELLSYQNCDKEHGYQPTAVVDGLLMMTQTDIRWREDLFQHWHFYDLSQCMEFVRAGYEVGIPYQFDPWAVHDCGVADLSGFEENRLLFIQEYQEDMHLGMVAYYERVCNQPYFNWPDGADQSLIQKHLQEYGVIFAHEQLTNLSRSDFNAMKTDNKIRISEMVQKVRETEGFLMELEMISLLHLPSLVDHLPGEIVEIGTFKGKSAIALGLGSQNLTLQKRPIHVIDPFYHPALPANYEEDFTLNIRTAGLEPHVIPIKKPSQEAYDDCPATIAALFIDGDHSYEGVVHDIVHYASRVVPGGIIAFHDYSYQECPGYEWAELPGVTRAVDEMCAQDNYTYCVTI